MREFVEALRQLRFPIVMIAVAILLLQTLVAGLATAHAAARIATFGTDAAVICHGNGDDGTAGSSQAAHECCTFCTAAAPATLTPTTSILARIAIQRHAGALAPAHDLRRPSRAIRAGPSQAPPTHS